MIEQYKNPLDIILPEEQMALDTFNELESLGKLGCLLELIDRYKNGLGVTKNKEKAKRLQNLVNRDVSRYDIKKELEAIANSVDLTISMPQSLYGELSHLAAQQDRTISELIEKKITGAYFYD